MKLACSILTKWPMKISLIQHSSTLMWISPDLLFPPISRNMNNQLKSLCRSMLKQLITPSVFLKGKAKILCQVWTGLKLTVTWLEMSFCFRFEAPPRCHVEFCQFLLNNVGVAAVINVKSGDPFTAAFLTCR